MFDHERLDACQLELRLVTWVTDILEETRESKLGSTRETRDQIDRESISIVLNTAEGNGKRQRPVRARYFDDARGSATEAAACLDVMVAKRTCSPERTVEGIESLARIEQMLTKLVQMYSDETNARE